MTNAFENRALPLIARGIPVVPLRPRTKVAFFPNWQDIASTDAAKIRKWGEDYPEANVASVAKANPGGVWFFEVDNENFHKTIEQHTGEKFPNTFIVRSSPGRGHFYFRQNAASIAMGNRQGKVDGKEAWSARVDDRYVVGPGSIHPTTGNPYEILVDAPIVEAPDWLIQYCTDNDAKETATRKPELNDDELIAEGNRNNKLTSILGKARQNLRMDAEQLYEYGLSVNRKRCRPPLGEAEVRRIANSIARYRIVPSAMLIDGNLPVQAVGVLDAVPPANEQFNRVDLGSTPGLDWLPGRTLASTRLQDIFIEHFDTHDWPLSLALPALVTAASVVVPHMPREEGILVIGDDPMTNLYTALIGDIGVGKSEVIRWAAKAIGIYSESSNGGSHYLESSFGSAEQMLKSLVKKQDQFANKAALVNPDEWAQVFAKMSIPDATFPMVLSTLYYRRNYNFTLGGSGGGKSYSLNLALSLIGGIVEQDFDTVFGAKTLGGLYDRFLFGRAQDNFRWSYRPCPIPEVPYFRSWDMKSVRQDPSVFEVIRSWSKKNYGRITEICSRIALIYAALDGRPEITGKDLEILEPLAQYQVGLRQIFKPNAGETPEAIFANKALAWVNKNAAEWTPISRLKQHLWRLEERLGPNVAERALSSLARGGRIELWLATSRDPNNAMPSDYHGPRVRIGLVRMVK